MKVIIKHIDSDIPKENHEFYTDFIKYLQKIKPLKDNITIKFVGEREGDMTTGQRNTKNELDSMGKTIQQEVSTEDLGTLKVRGTKELLRGIQEDIKSENKIEPLFE